MHADKYPPESDRRRFVKGVVGTSALASVGAGASAVVSSSTHRGGGTGGPTDFVGIENTSGPAPRGMPIVPVTLDDDGYLTGIWPEVKEKELKDGSTIQVTEQEMGDVTYTGRWFQYCGIQTAPGLKPTADQDPYLRSAGGQFFDWQNSVEKGSKLHVDDFDDYEEWGNGIGKSGLGKPAQATWRSQAAEGEDIKEIPVQVLRSTKVSQLREDSDHAAFLKEATESDFIAWLDKCTHFCCTPAFKAFDGSAKFGAANEVYCQCHQSVYDPFSPVELSFNAFPRPE
jgi:Rieske Fe-S protein